MGAIAVDAPEKLGLFVVFGQGDEILSISNTDEIELGRGDWCVVYDDRVSNEMDYSGGIENIGADGEYLKSLLELSTELSQRMDVEDIAPSVSFRYRSPEIIFYSHIGLRPDEIDMLEDYALNKDWAGLKVYVSLVLIERYRRARV